MKHFKLEEFKCPCCNKAKMSQEFLNIVDEFRDKLGFPLTINSGFRCESHNKAIGGVKDSQHLQGIAADISIKGLTAIQRYKFSLLAHTMFRGVGVSKTFFHLDSRPVEFPMFWVY